MTPPVMNDAGLKKQNESQRLLSALLLLQAHGKLTGRALAERERSGRDVPEALPYRQD